MADCLDRLERKGKPLIVGTKAAAPQPEPNKMTTAYQPIVVRVIFEHVEGSVLCMAHNANEIWIGTRNGEIRAFSLR
ncbi:hypothetical protein, partial [Salmonella enterica]|uniref:hypothetical protein n=1 Tax=Salmonella enterica TaxID=28901 RepID=UPI0035237442